MATLGEAIKAAREHKGLNQAEFANLCGLTPAAICQIEGDKRKPSLPSVRQILGVLDLTFEQLCEVQTKRFCPVCKRPY